MKKDFSVKRCVSYFQLLQRLKEESNLHHFIRLTGVRGSKCFMEVLTLHTVLEHAEVLSKNIHIRGKIIAKLLFQKELYIIAVALRF